MLKKYISGIILSIMACSTLHASTLVINTIENFSNNTLPAGWTIKNNTPNPSTWRFDNPATRTDTGGVGGFAIADSDYYGFDTPMDTELQTPAYDFSMAATVNFAFKTNFMPGYVDICDVDVTIDNGTTWTNVWRKTGAPYSSPSENINITSLAAGKNNVKIRFHYYNANFDWYWMVDDVVISNIPVEPPGPPTIGTATKTIGTATISFTPPAYDGGLPIIGYTITSIPNYLTANGTSSPITISNLNQNLYYAFTVAANNAVGPGASSLASNSIIPSYPPDAPTIGTVTAGYRQVTIPYGISASDNGGTITTYSAKSNPGNITVNSLSNPIIITGLADNTNYTFTITATNAAGTSSLSTVSNSITTATMPVQINSLYYPTVQTASDSVIADNTIIKIATGTLAGPLSINLPYITEMIGGYDSSFTNVTDYSTITGTMTLVDGTTTINNIIIK